MLRPVIAGGVGLVVSAALAPADAVAIVVRDDVARPGDAAYDPNVDPYVQRGGRYGAVAFIGAGDAIGTGVLITNEWVLTAGHIVDSAVEGGAVIAFDNGGLSLVDVVYRHEHYLPYDPADAANTGPAGGFDIGLMHLADPVPTDPHDPDYIRPMQRYRGPANGMIGRVGTSVGYGLTGDGRVGFDDPANPDPDESLEHFDGEKRAGDNVIDGTADRPAFHGPYANAGVRSQFIARPGLGLTKEQVAAQYLVSDFDAPGPDALPFEASVAPGDSGGPVFIDGGDPDSVDDDLIVGIHSFVFGPPAPFGDGTDNASYGDLYGSINVAMFNDWIDPLVGVPEPTAPAALLTLAAAAVVRRRRR